MVEPEEPFDWDRWPVALIAAAVALLLGLGFAGALLLKGSP